MKKLLAWVMRFLLTGSVLGLGAWIIYLAFEISSYRINIAISVMAIFASVLIFTGGNERNTWADGWEYQNFLTKIVCRFVFAASFYIPGELWWKMLEIKKWLLFYANTVSSSALLESVIISLVIGFMFFILALLSILLGASLAYNLCDIITFLKNRINIFEKNIFT